jgi:DUF1680 family protein
MRDALVNENLHAMDLTVLGWCIAAYLRLISIYIYIYTYTHTHTYIHTYIQDEFYLHSHAATLTISTLCVYPYTHLSL